MTDGAGFPAKWRSTFSPLGSFVLEFCNFTAYIFSSYLKPFLLVWLFSFIYHLRACSKIPVLTWFLPPVFVSLLTKCMWILQSKSLLYSQLFCCLVTVWSFQTRRNISIRRVRIKTIIIIIIITPTKKVVGMAVVKYTTFYYSRTVYLEVLKFTTQQPLVLLSVSYRDGKGLGTG